MCIPNLPKGRLPLSKKYPTSRRVRDRYRDRFKVIPEALVLRSGVFLIPGVVQGGSTELFLACFVKVMRPCRFPHGRCPTPSNCMCDCPLADTWRFLLISDPPSSRSQGIAEVLSAHGISWKKTDFVCGGIVVKLNGTEAPLCPAKSKTAWNSNNHQCITTDRKWSRWQSGALRATTEGATATRITVVLLRVGTGIKGVAPVVENCNVEH